MTTPTAPLRIALFVTGLRESYVDCDDCRAEMRPDTYLFSIIEHLRGIGFSVRVFMPEQKRIIQASIRGDFSGVASDLEEYLTSDDEGKEIRNCPCWVVIGHSAGGLAIYKWVESWASKTRNVPKAIYVFDSPFQLTRRPGPVVPGVFSEDEDRRLKVRDLPCQLVDISALVSKLSKLKSKMIRFCAGDNIFIGEERLIPPTQLRAGILDQYDMAGSGHNEICACDSALRILIRDVRKKCIKQDGASNGSR